MKAPFILFFSYDLTSLGLFPILDYATSEGHIHFLFLIIMGTYDQNLPTNWKAIYYICHFLDVTLYPNHHVAGKYVDSLGYQGVSPCSLYTNTILYVPSHQYNWTQLTSLSNLYSYG